MNVKARVQMILLSNSSTKSSYLNGTVERRHSFTSRKSISSPTIAITSGAPPRQLHQTHDFRETTAKSLLAVSHFSTHVVLTY
jgi:hypothetical protein